MDKAIFVDLETTGLDPQHDKICQIGILLPDGSEWESLINPGIQISPEAFAIHGINNDKVKDAPTLNQIAPRLIQVLESAEIFVAYNYVFDFIFLQKELFQANGYFLNEKKYIFIDPYRIFKKMFPRNLSNAYKFYTGKTFEKAHNAIEDIKATREILEKQKEFYPDFFAKSLAEISQLSAGDTSILGKWFEKNDKGDYNFKQGKYKGETLSLQHRDYLRWIYKLEDTTLSEKFFIDSFI